MFGVSINYFAVFLAAVLNMVIGYAWYSQSLFGKEWMKMIGMTADKMKSGMGKAIGMGLVTSFISAWVLAYLISVTGASGIAEAAQIAFWVWLGFTATAMFSSVLYENKPTKLWAINVGYYLVAYIVMAIAIVLWV